MSQRFYVNWALQPGVVEIAGAEAHHLAAVCRLRPGDAVCLFNGDGKEYPARVAAVARRKVTLEVVAVASPNRELAFPLTVAAPLPKGDRAQFFVEKLTELGATAYVPLRTERSVVHPGESKTEKLQRYVIEASKQCGRNVLMNVAALADWAEFCQRGDLSAQKVLAHRGKEGQTASAPDIFSAPVPAAGLIAAVGPEGGFTMAELDRALAYGWKQIDLGPRILRVETAAVVVAAVAGLLPAIEKLSSTSVQTESSCSYYLMGFVMAGPSRRGTPAPGLRASAANGSAVAARKTAVGVPPSSAPTF